MQVDHPASGLTMPTLLLREKTLGLLCRKIVKRCYFAPEVGNRQRLDRNSWKGVVPGLYEDLSNRRDAGYIGHCTWPTLYYGLLNMVKTEVASADSVAERNCTRRQNFECK
mgnify:CR=1 FL=1